MPQIEHGGIGGTGPFLLGTTKRGAADAQTGLSLLPADLTISVSFDPSAAIMSALGDPHFDCDLVSLF